MTYGKDSMLMVAERILDGVVLRYNDSNSDEDYIRIEIPMRVGLYGLNSIVDIETSGFAPYGSVVTFGAIIDNRIVVIQRLKSNPPARERFKERIQTELDYLSDTAIFAFCCDFERGFLGKAYHWKELKPMCGGKKDDIVKFKNLHFGEGSDVPLWWRSWKRTHDFKYIRNIILHNVNCLVKEMAILLSSDENAL